MKTLGEITFSELNSSGDGTLTYKTKAGSIVFEYSRWGEVVSIPTADEWKTKFGTSWARDQRDVIIQDLISQLVSVSRPNFEITKHAIVFFDAKEREVARQHYIASASAAQAPALDKFLADFEKIAEADKIDTIVCVLDIVSASAETAECIISEVLHGSKALTGNHLKLAFDKDVPMLAGRKYITRESEKVLKQYVNTSYNWRCRLHVEQTQSEVDLARKYFSASK